MIRLAGKSMINLSQTYSELGRLADALAMQEKVLEHFRRVLPADHPDIGEGCVGRDAFHSACIDFDERGFDLTCRVDLGQPRVYVLLAWKARRCARSWRKGAGVLSSRAACGPSRHR